MPLLIASLLFFLPSCTGDEAPSSSPSESAPVAASEQMQERPARDTTEDGTEGGKGGVQGVVRNADEEPLAQASLFFADLEMGAATGEDGRYTIRGIPPGTRTLTVSHGESRKEIEVDILPDSLVHLDVTLD